MNKLVLYNNIVIGMLVQDSDIEFGIGIIKECNDIHNVFVEFVNGASGLYCLDENCDDYDPLYYL
jgi:hypothetical protein